MRTGSHFSYSFSTQNLSPHVMETMQNDRLGASFGVTVSKYDLAVWSAPEAVFRPAEVQAGVVVFTDTLAPRYAPGCAGVRERAPPPRSVAQSVRDHAPGCDRDTVRILKLKQRVKNWKKKHAWKHIRRLLNAIQFCCFAFTCKNTNNLRLLKESKNA